MKIWPVGNKYSNRLSKELKNTYWGIYARSYYKWKNPNTTFEEWLKVYVERPINPI